MKKSISIIFFVLFSLIYLNSITKEELMLNNIHWYGQSSVKIITGNMIIYIDPVNINNNDKADIILITHTHGDHFSVKDIQKLSKEDTLVIAPFKIDEKNTILIPDKIINVKNIKIETVPAYNVVKTQLHPRSNNFVGYIITVDGTRIYHTGDTERIPEMKQISCDIIMLPLGQKYTMNSVDEAVQSVLDVKAKIAIPIHFGLYEGTNDDAKYFINELTKNKIKALVLQKE